MNLSNFLSMIVPCLTSNFGVSIMNVRSQDSTLGRCDETKRSEPKQVSDLIRNHRMS
jgi:hypothetical protein